MIYVITDYNYIMTSIATLLGLNNSSPTEDKPAETSCNQETMEHQKAMPFDIRHGEHQKEKPFTPKNLDTKSFVDTTITEPESELDENTNGEEQSLKPSNDDDDEDVPDIKEDENVPDINLLSVKELQSVLGNMKYEDVRKGLYKKYGLITKDEETIPGLYMITYNKPDRISSKNKVVLTKEQQQFVSQYRGVIVEKDTNQPVCYTFEKMSRHFPDEWDLTNCNITSSCDGSQIKVFYYKAKGHWVVSTTRRIDAARSYFFSNKSFREMFQDASTSLNWDTLNKNFCYSFVLAHPDNRVVARHNKPFLTHVFSRNMETYEVVNDDIGIPRPQPFSFKNKNDIWKAIKRLPYYKEGFVVQKGDVFIKLVNSKYQEVKDLRGSSNSLLFHYFNLKKQNKIRSFLSYFPESSETFKYFEGCFQNLCLLAYNEYILLRVRKVILPPQVLQWLRPVLYKLHGLHINNKIRIRLVDVKAHMEKYEPYLLRRLVDLANGLPYTLN